MMGVTSLEVYNTIYNITEKNKKLKLFGTEKMLKEYKFATEFIPKIKHLYETSDIEEIRKLINDVKFKKVVFPNNYYDDLNKIIIQINQNIKIKQIFLILMVLDLYLIAWE